MSKKHWLALTLTLTLFAALACTYNFRADRERMRAILAPAHNGDVSRTLQALEATGYLLNPPLNLFLQLKKRHYLARFVHKTERFEPVSSDETVEAIVGAFRRHWNDRLTQGTATDEDLHAELAQILSEAGHPTDGTSEDVFSGVTHRIEAAGLHVAFFHLNGAIGLKIWDHETTEHRRVELPDETIDVEVVHVAGYRVRGLNSYATLEEYADGGWVTQGRKVYCNSEEYDFESEAFHVSFLKHEGMHYADIGNHPNLSAADMEYRAKVVELMYSTDAQIYTVLQAFLTEADATDRTSGHGYANHVITANLSKVLFEEEDVVTDMDRWRAVAHPRINTAATTLYDESRSLLAADPTAAEVI
jgi:hypothetical protein